MSQSPTRIGKGLRFKGNEADEDFKDEIFNVLQEDEDNLRKITSSRN
jgi:hypothetical protein